MRRTRKSNHQVFSQDLLAWNYKLISHPNSNQAEDYIICKTGHHLSSVASHKHESLASLKVWKFNLVSRRKHLLPKSCPTHLGQLNWVDSTKTLSLSVMFLDPDKC